MKVDTARDGKMAVEAFDASAVGEYRCILMDIMMPM
jgi:CheY-like chemotaxis protein